MTCPLFRSSATCFGLWALVQLYAAIASSFANSPNKKLYVLNAILSVLTMANAYMMWNDESYLWYYMNLTVFLLQFFNVVENCKHNVVTKSLYFSAVGIGFLSIAAVFTITSYNEYMAA